jgi:tetratricopeptide (TPR) repeat protein
MNLKISSHTLLAVATVITVIQSAVMIPIVQFKAIGAPAVVGPKFVKQNSNMVPMPAGSQKKPGANVEKAKEAMFRDGNYVKAKQYLDAALKTEPNEPLTYAMNALYPFSAGDYEKVREYGEKTSNAAIKLMKTNPMRGNLYQGVGFGILGAYEMKKANGGALGALNKLQKVFEYMDKAKKLDPRNPELNLVKGYMDLLLAVNVPFSDTTQAIEQLKNAEPKYLALRGMYVGYRDLKDYDKATTAINAAIKLAPQNPELTYYKAQLLGIRGREQQNDSDLKQSIELFEAAYQKSDRLLLSSVAQILTERCQAKTALNKTNADGCWGFEAQLKQSNPRMVVGLTKLPALN